MPEERLIYAPSDIGLLPEALTPAWTKTGAGAVSIVNDGWEFDTTGGLSLIYDIDARDGDPSDAPTRFDDVMRMQVRVRGESQSADGLLGFWLGDGQRELGVSLGAALELVDPATYTTTVLEVQETWTFTRERVLQLTKWGTEFWELRVDGVVVGRVAYRAAPTMTGRAYFAAGQFVAGSVIAVWEFFEASLNLSLPPQWKVERQVNDLPTKIRENFDVNHRALVRMLVGVQERATDMLDAVWRSTTEGRIESERFEFTGQRLPSAEDPAWTQSGVTISLVRERVRFTAVGAQPFARAAYVAIDVKGEYSVKMKAIARSYVAGGNSEIGPAIIIDDGVAQAWIYLREYPGAVAGSDWCWEIGSAVGTPLSTRYWHVNAYQEMNVEVQVLGEDWLLLIVDGQVVERLAYADLGASGAAGIPARSVTVGTASSMTATFDLWDVEAVTRLSDFGERPLQKQVSIERIVGWGGAERNDEIGTWNHNRFGQQDYRGTTRGILIELERIANTSRVYFWNQEFPGRWILSQSWPGITPIWLSLEGTLLSARVGFYRNCPNFTAQSLACFAWRYLVPRSTVEAGYIISNLVAATAGIVAGAAVVVATEAIVPESDFSVGDTAILTSFDLTAFETVTIQAVTAASITLTTVVGTYAYAPATPPLIWRDRADTGEPACGAGLAASPSPGTPIPPVIPAAAVVVCPLGASAGAPFEIEWSTGTAAPDDFGSAANPATVGW